MITTLQSERVANVQTKRSLISWGAIFAGWLIGNAVMLLLFNFGSAIGLSVVNVSDAGDMAKGFAIGSAIFALVTWAISFYLAGYIASWLAGRIDKTTGLFHGISVWALAVVFTVFLGVTGVAGAANVVKSLGKGALMLGSQGVEAVQNSNAAPQSVIAKTEQALKNQISQTLSQTSAVTGGAAVGQREIQQTIDDINPQILAAISGQILQGDVEGAKTALAQNTELSRAEVEQIVDGIALQSNQLKAQATEVAEKTADYSAAALWVLFFSGLLGLVAASLGGLAGSGRWERAVRRFEHAEV